MTVQFVDARMRTRRRFVTVASASVVTGLAGCVDDGAPSDEGPTDESANDTDGEPSDDGATNDTDAMDPASITATSIEAPSRADLGDPFDLEVTLRNDGQASGSYPLEVYRRRGAEWERIHSEDVSVEADATSSVTISGVNGSVVGPLRFRVGSDGPTAETAVGGAQRTVGERFTSDGVAFSVDAIEYRREYVWQDDESERRVKAPDRQQYAWVTVTAENVAETRRDLPRPRDFSLLLQGDEYEPADIKRERDRYEGGSVLSGTQRSGWIAFQIPNQIPKDEVRIAWDHRSDEGELQAYWRPE